MTAELPVLDEAEVVVVGAGPAGAVAAATLAQLGREVILVDQSAFPRDKPCGDGLWSSAVAFLEDLGLDELIAGSQPIEGTRIVRAQGGRPIERAATSRGRRPLPRCVPRRQLDATLLEVALASGARFVHGRVQETIEQDGRVVAVEVRRTSGERAAVRARHSIAADGATSRMRRLMGVGPPPFGLRAHAVRQYVRTEEPLDPLFEMRIPLRFGDRLLPGYSWIFPIAENVANIGVAFFRDPNVDRSKNASLRKPLESFVEELRSDPPARYGEIESLTEPYGAPVAVGFSAAAVQRENVLFVGDAARMTDPLIGEGIGAALRGGREAANEVDRLLRQGGRRHFGARLLREFPRLGQDTGVVIRMHDRLVADAGPSQQDGGEPREGHPFLENVAWLLVRGSDDDPPIKATPVFRLAEAQSDDARTALGELDVLALDTLRTEFPFALDLLHRALRSGVGPSCAATLLLAEMALGGRPDTKSVAAALASELLVLAVQFLGKVSDDVDEGAPNLGNGFATLIADYALSHGLRAATHLGPQETARLARLARTVHEGAMLDVDDSWKVGRSTERYFAAVGDQAGSLHAHGAGLGARLAGKERAVADLERYGYNLGVALEISNDVVELVAGDYATTRAPGEALRHGSYTLPVIYALEDDPGLRGLLGPTEIEDVLEDVVKRIRATNAIERCASQCEQYAEKAKVALAQLDLEDAGGLLELADLAVGRCSECLREPAAQAVR